MYPEPYIEYLAHFHGDHDFFECHEILEEYWKEVDPGNKESIWVAFIQLAVGCYHYRRGNIAGAIRTLQKSLDLFKLNETSIPLYGVDKEQLLKHIKLLIEDAEAGNPYKYCKLPIIDNQLIKLWKSECLRKGVKIGGTDYIPAEAIVQRHKLRDRTDVIHEREQALRRRKRNT